MDEDARIPGLSRCIELFDAHGMLDNIRHHSLVVAEASMRIARGLAEKTPDRPQPDLKLVMAGALLHDIAKTPCLGGRCNHAEVGAAICLDAGWPEVAEIVGQHVYLQPFDTPRYEAGVFFAKEIVHYADKRVRHHEVVSLEERLEYILERYCKDNPERRRRSVEHFAQCRLLERLLFRWLPFAPEDLRAC